jgi:5-methylcytosine-specific restriction endonuclease McrBC regulatory subunit McrC
MGKKMKITESAIRRIVREAYQELSGAEEEAKYNDSLRKIAGACMETGFAMPFSEYSDYHDFCVFIKKGLDPNCMDEPLAKLGIIRRPDKTGAFPANGGYAVWYTDLSPEDSAEYFGC